MVLLWYIPSVLLIILLGALVRRQAYRRFPCFFAYVSFGVVADTARLLAVHNKGLYFVTYWGTEAGYWLLGIVVMYEVLKAALGTFARTAYVRGIFLLILVAGIGLSFARSHAAPSPFSGLRFYILAGAIVVRFVEVIIFAGLVSLVPILGLRWRQYSFGIATGFGLYATIALLLTTKFSDFGTRFKFFWDATLVVAYSLAVLIWIWFFSVPQKMETPSSEMSAPSPGELKQYKDALRRMR